MKPIEKGEARIWHCNSSKHFGLVWTKADIIDGRYCNHQRYQSLIDALKDINEII